MNIGIICEYNPFHYGHLYHINKIKEMYPNCNLILVLSGWITERGDLSIMDKWKKTDIALNYGVDLVVELPFKYIQSADFFSMGAIKILNELNCDTIIFGSECYDINILTKLARAQINNNKFEELIKIYSKNNNYPTAVSIALTELTGEKINTPNDILGISYIKEIIKNNYNIKPILIKRNNEYNSKKLESKITSATSIREAIKKNKKIKKYVPPYCYKYIKDCIFIEDYFDFLKYKIISTNDLTIYQGVSVDLQNRIKKFINDAFSLDEFLNIIKSKKYTYNRLKRILTYILLSIRKSDCNNLDLEYIRILGFNKNGRHYLNKIRKNINIPILTNYNNKYLNKDLNITNIISLNSKIKNKKNFIEKEYKQKPIIK